MEIFTSDVIGCDGMKTWPYLCNLEKTFLDFLVHMTKTIFYDIVISIDHTEKNLGMSAGGLY